MPLLYIDILKERIAKGEITKRAAASWLISHGMWPCAAWTLLTSTRSQS